MGANLTFLDSENLVSKRTQDAAIGDKAVFSTVDNYCTPDSMDLNKILIRHSASTFFARVVGDSLIEEGIGDGDLLIIDKSVDVYNGAVVVVYVDEDFTLMRASVTKDGVTFKSFNQETDIYELKVWGVVRYAIKRL